MNELQRSIKNDIDEVAPIAHKAVLDALDAAWNTPDGSAMEAILRYVGVSFDIESESVERLRELLRSFAENHDAAYEELREATLANVIDGYVPGSDGEGLEKAVDERLNREVNLERVQALLIDASDDVVTISETLESDDATFDDDVWTKASDRLENVVETLQLAINRVHHAAAEVQKFEDVLDDFLQAGK